MNNGFGEEDSIYIGYVSLSGPHDIFIVYFKDN